MEANCILELMNVGKIYGSGSTQVEALKNVNFSIKKGEFISIIGESGSGKSTLLNVIGMLDNPTSGKIIIDGVEQKSMSMDQQAIFRRDNIGFIFQSFNLIQELTVEQNIAFPILLSHKKPEMQRIDSIIRKLGLNERRDHMPSQLSGGQQQRVAIGRALVTEPKLILADEPTGNLDSKNSQEVIRLLLETSKEYNKTVLLITHNAGIAKLADRIFYVKDGYIDETKQV